jgi:hypothetical protein
MIIENIVNCSNKEDKSSTKNINKYLKELYKVI